MASSPAARFFKTVYMAGDVVAAVLIVIALCLPLPAGAEYKVVDFPTADTIHMVVGQTRILESDQAVDFEKLRIMVENPGVAEARHQLNGAKFTSEIFLTGKKPGTTRLIIFQDNAAVMAYQLSVGYDVTGLKQKLHALLPEEKQIQVMTTNETITLAGKVSNVANLSIVMDLAGAYFPEDKINNLLEVGGVHQVMLEVRVAEMQRSLGRRLGVNFTYARGQDFALSMLAGLTNTNVAGNILDTTVSSAVNAMFNLSRGSADWTFFLDALKSEGLVKILAEPNLISLSGQTASFIVGGEFPVPEVGTADASAVSISWKEYGIGIEFTPTVLNDKKISLNVHPFVSDIDTTNAVQLSGFFVPSLTKREASTMVELGDGQSFAIAGLLRENVRNAYSKFPLLGDIPILGALFRSTEFQKNETELVIIITPRIVKPLDPGAGAAPTDFYIEPDDSEFYIMGMMEGDGKGDVLSGAGRMDGSFGHEVPPPE